MADAIPSNNREEPILNTHSPQRYTAESAYSVPWYLPAKSKGIKVISKHVLFKFYTRYFRKLFQHYLKQISIILFLPIGLIHLNNHSLLICLSNLYKGNKFLSTPAANRWRSSEHNIYNLNIYIGKRYEYISNDYLILKLAL